MRAALFGVLIISFAQLAHLGNGGNLLMENPNLRAFQASIHFWETGNLTNPKYYEMHNQLIEKSTSSKIWQDVYSETSSGLLVHKLSLIFIVLASPVLGLLGLKGIIVVNLFLWFVIIFCFFNVFKQNGGRHPLFFISCLFFGTQAWSHALIPTLETNPVFVLSLALYLSSKFPALAGALAALSALHRPTNALCAIAIGLQSNQRIKALFGVGIGLLFFANFNLLVWGDFFTTQYHRMPFYEYGTVSYKSGVTSFELVNIAIEPFDKLFSTKHGIITYNLLLLSLIFIRGIPVFLSLNFFLQAALILCYSGYSIDGTGYNSSGGNRYLTCAILLLLPYLAASLEKRILNRYKTNTTRANHQY